MKSPDRRLSDILALTSAALCAFWACAPPTSLPPPVPMGADGPVDREFGGALSLGSPESQIDSDHPASVDTHLWFHRERPNGMWLGSTLYAGTSSFGGLGTYVQIPFNDNPDFFIGTRLELGWLWGTVGFPISKRVGEDTWVYTSPSIGYRLSGPVALPVGVSMPFRSADTRLSMEARLSNLVSLGYYDNELVFLGSVGLSKRW